MSQFDVPPQLIRAGGLAVTLTAYAVCSKCGYCEDYKIDPQSSGGKRFRAAAVIYFRSVGWWFKFDCGGRKILRALCPTCRQNCGF